MPAVNPAGPEPMMITSRTFDATWNPPVEGVWTPDPATPIRAGTECEPLNLGPGPRYSGSLNSGPDPRLSGGRHRVRHAQGRRSRHRHRGHPPPAQERRQERGVSRVVKRLLFVLLLLPGAAAYAAPKDAEFLPMKIGAKWNYAASDG